MRWDCDHVFKRLGLINIHLQVIKLNHLESDNAIRASCPLTLSELGSLLDSDGGTDIIAHALVFYGLVVASIRKVEGAPS